MSYKRKRKKLLDFSFNDSKIKSETMKNDFKTEPKYFFMNRNCEI